MIFDANRRYLGDLPPPLQEVARQYGFCAYRFEREGRDAALKIRLRQTEGTVRWDFRKKEYVVSFPGGSHPKFFKSTKEVQGYIR